ncbi:MAG: DUF3105 domain-containing protein [Anaerolineales bacterium]|nr:DUF3105 domain-containing protein [Chloroflexota bacterium]MBL6980352.1 DUF3105 domain-containing protein [Anaerolineales bacterium]
MRNKRLRDSRREKKRKKKLTSSLIWGGIVLVLLIIGAFIIYDSSRPSEGETIPIMADAGAHVPEGQDPGPFNSDPPTSGRHYNQPLDAGFYEEGDPETLTDYPEGYLLHSLEHGYVIFWYNCDALDNVDDCNQLKDGIKEVMDRFLSVKLIAYPWTSIDVPVVMTTWGQMMRFEKFDEGIAREFVQANRNRAPEPNAP